MSEAQIKAALVKIKDHIANKTPAPCNPTFMDGDGQWWQIREWPTLGLTRSSTGPHGKRSKVQPSQSWSHSLMPETYPTLDALLIAMEAAAICAPPWSPRHE